MRIKKKYLNEETLSHYGFEKKFLYDGELIDGYLKICEYCDIFIPKTTGEIIISPEYDCDSFNLDDVIYRLIVDGLVEDTNPARIMHEKTFNKLKGFARAHDLALIGGFEEERGVYFIWFWNRNVLAGFRKEFTEDELSICTMTPETLTKNILNELRDTKSEWFEEK